MLYKYILTHKKVFAGMNRGMLTSLLLQSLFVILVFKVKSILKIVILDLVSRWIIPSISESFPSFLPRSVMWVYMYITSSINNIENMINQFEDFQPYVAIYLVFILIYQCSKI